MLVIRAGIHKILVTYEKLIRKTLIRQLLQKQSDLILLCLSRPYCQAISVQDILTSTLFKMAHIT